MSANNLLMWMSARGAGSWQQFRAAVEEMHLSNDPDLTDEEDTEPSSLPLYQSLRLNIQRIGHAEFFFQEDEPDWRVTPPSLAISRVKGEWRGLVVGARSQRLIEMMAGEELKEMRQILQFPMCPDQILFRSNRQDTLISAATKIGLIAQCDAPLALLTCLPAIDSPYARAPFPMPFGKDWKIERFSPEELRWRSSDRDAALHTVGGLFRFTLWYQRYVLFCSNGQSFRIGSQVGKYLSLKRRRRQVLRYDSGVGSLAVPPGCRPPFLIERALIMCSGSLPEYSHFGDSNVLVYTDIPHSIAEIAAALLRQELR